MEAGRLRSCRCRQQARKFFGADIVCPEKVIQVQGTVFANEKSAKALRKFDVSWAPNPFRIGKVTEIVWRFKILTDYQSRHDKRNPYTVFSCTGIILLAVFQIEGIDRAGINSLARRLPPDLT